MKHSVILASGSKWRKRLLARNGIKARIHVSEFKEMERHKNPRYLAIFNARGKARMVATEYNSGVVIGVDTIGVLGKKILLKPRDRADAGRMIRMLAGTRHKVISGLCVINCKTKAEVITSVTTFITFREVEDAELEKYLDSNQWQGKAGSYAIQGRAKGFVKKIDGDVTNVIGLPIPTLKKILQKF